MYYIMSNVFGKVGRVVFFNFTCPLPSVFRIIAGPYTNKISALCVADYLTKSEVSK